MARTMANMVSMLMEKPKKPMTPKVPRMTTGTAMVGIRVARMLPMKSHMMRKTSMMASKKGLDHLVDGGPDEGGGVVGVDDLHALREIAAHLLHLGLDGVGRIQGVRARRAAGWPCAAEGLPL